MSNVVLIGGGSLFSGFAERLANELSRSFPHVRNNVLLVYRSLIDNPFAVDRLKYMRLATPLSAVMEAGWVVAS